jgi:hypothetical protein
MDNNIDHLKILLEQVKTIGWWDRLFSWKRIKERLVDAMADLQKLISAASYSQQQVSLLQGKNDELNKEVRAFTALQAKEEVKQEKLNEDLLFARTQVDEYKKQEALLRDEHQKSMAALRELKNEVREEREKEKEEINRAKIERLELLKVTWSRHQENVKNNIRAICSRLTIEYVDKVPFKGEPDNTVKICDEFIILDAKSPANDDLSHFPIYLKDQAEKAKKYAKEDSVRKEIYLVVPANTLDHLHQFVYKLGDYTVFIIAIDALEPVLISLQKLESYEFAEQLSPEERENICRVLGKFAHLAKRRIQIDSFFIKQFIELAYKCESDLPSDILDKVIEFERAEKINPPADKRSKQLNLKELEKDTNRLAQETQTKGIAASEENMSISINSIPLYTDEAGQA